jgi:hypothetical protein
MEMIWHKHPGKYIHSAVFDQNPKPIDKVRSISVVVKDASFFDAPAHHVVQNPGSI